MAGAEPLGASLEVDGGIAANDLIHISISVYSYMLVYSARLNWQWEKGKGVSDENHHSPVSRAQRPTPLLPDMLDEVPKADNVFDTIEAHCQIKFQALNKSLMHTQRAMVPTKGVKD